MERNGIEKNRDSTRLAVRKSPHEELEQALIKWVRMVQAATIIHNTCPEAAKTIHNTCPEAATTIHNTCPGAVPMSPEKPAAAEIFPGGHV